MSILDKRTVRNCEDRAINLYLHQQNGDLQDELRKDNEEITKLKRDLKTEIYVNKIIKQQIDEFLQEISEEYPDVLDINPQMGKEKRPFESNLYFSIHPCTMMEMLFEICRKRGLIKEFFGDLQEERDIEHEPFELRL